MTRTPLIRGGVLAPVALLLLVLPLAAQSLPAGFHDRSFAANRPLDGGDARPSEESEPWVVPGLAATIPVAPGLGWGELFAGGAYQYLDRDRDVAVAGAGFGLGDPRRWVGVQVAVNSFSAPSTRIPGRGAVDVHLSRHLPADFAVGIGWEGVHRWGGPRAPSSGYAVVSRWFDLQADVPGHFGQGMVTIGVGSGRFQSADNLREGLDRAGLFAAASLRIAAPLALIAEWTGQDVFVGTSVTPFQDHRIAATAGMGGLTGGDGAGSRFILGSSLVLRPFQKP